LIKMDSITTLSKKGNKKGIGRPKTSDNLQPVNMVIEEKTLNRLDEIKANWNLSRSETISRLINLTSKGELEQQKEIEELAVVVKRYQDRLEELLKQNQTLNRKLEAKSFRSAYDTRIITQEKAHMKNKIELFKKGCPDKEELVKQIDFYFLNWLDIINKKLERKISKTEYWEIINQVIDEK